MVAAPSADLVEMEVLICLGVVLICLACVSKRLPWALDKVTASVEKQFGPSAVFGKSNRAASFLFSHLVTKICRQQFTSFLTGSVSEFTYLNEFGIHLGAAKK